MAEAWSEEAQQGMVVSQRSQFKEPAASGLQAGAFSRAGS